MKSKDLNFEYIEDFADYIVEKVEDDEELFVSIVGKSEEIKNIIKEIITITDVDFEKICLYNAEVDEYKDEYILDCWYDDGVVQIGCEPAKRDGKYLNLAGDETYLISNVSSKIIPLCEDTRLYFVNIDEDYDCDEERNDECYCGCHKDDKLIECSTGVDGETHGFTASKSDDNGYHSFSFYTTNSLSEKDIHSILKEFGF